MDDDEFKRREAKQALEEAVAELARLQESRLDTAVAAGANCTAEPPLCSFCGKGVNQVRRMVQGQRGYICDGCILACGALIQKSGESGRS